MLLSDYPCRWQSIAALKIISGILAIAIISFPTHAWANNNRISSSGDDFEITIKNQPQGLMGRTCGISVIKSAGVGDIDRFDFRIRFNSAALPLFGINPGGLFQSPYEWEYFTYLIDTIPYGTGLYPWQTVKVTGVADLDDGDHHPTGKSIPDGTVLFNLNFLITTNRTYACNYLPVNFVWKDCDDNLLILPDSDTVIKVYSRDVYDPWGLAITSPAAPYPAIQGAPGECIELNDPDRRINFHNGGIDLVCNDSVSSNAGDLNLNGFQYDPGDAIVFDNYFQNGLTAFRINVMGQIEASDVDKDGTPLETIDYIYLLKLISSLSWPRF